MAGQSEQNLRIGGRASEVSGAPTVSWANLARQASAANSLSFGIDGRSSLVRLDRRDDFRSLQESCNDLHTSDVLALDP